MRLRVSVYMAILVYACIGSLSSGAAETVKSTIYKTARGEVFECNLLGTGKIDYLSCRARRAPGRSDGRQIWCDSGATREVHFYLSDLGRFECEVRVGLCSEVEYGLSNEFCVDFDHCSVAKEHQSLEEASCSRPKKVDKGTKKK